jgi:hypothetical protein
MTANWRLLEFFPKSDRYKECKQRRSFLGYYIPDAEPRAIPENACIHESAVKRMEAIAKISFGEYALSIPGRSVTIRPR